jgi:YesN/AraC family two-component response regulator
VLDYVNRRYCDGDISLERIADEHDVSVSFLSRFFKEQVGQTFTDYLSELRMNEAKQRLIHSQQSVGQIVEEIGYMNVSNFVRKFKKEEGVTPGQYRTLYTSGSHPEQEDALGD